MIVRPDAPLNTLSRGATTGALRNARLSIATPVAVAERAPSTGPVLAGRPLLRTGFGLVTSAGLGDLTSATAAVSGTVRDVALGDSTIAVITDDGVRVDGPGFVTRPTVIDYNLFGRSLASEPYYADRFEGWRLVPYTATGEAGRPIDISVRRLLLTATNETGAAGRLVQTFASSGVTVSGRVNAETSYVEVYKTYLTESGGQPPRLVAGSEDAATVDGYENFEVSNEPMDATVEFYYLGRYQAAQDGTARRVTIPDDTAFFSPSALTRYGVTEGVVLDGNDPLSRIVVPTEAYDQPTVLSVAKGVFGDATGGFAAGALHHSGGRTFYGNPTWRVGAPEATLSVDEETVVSERRGVIVTGTTSVVERHVFGRREYQVGGYPVLGPVTDFGEVTALRAAWAGEDALRIYVSPDGTLASALLYERLVWDPITGYLTAFRSTADELRDRRLTFDAAAYDPSRLKSENDGPLGGAPESVTTINEPRAVLLSGINRPREVRAEQFSIPEGTEVRAMFAARVSEDAGDKAYPFYVASDAGVWAAQLDGDAYLLDAVVTTWGAALVAGRPVFASVDRGAVLLGTDGHLHLLSGLRTERIDAPVPGLWSRVLSMAYDPRPSTETLDTCPDIGGLLWVLVEDDPDSEGAAAAFGGTGRSLYAYSFGSETTPAGWVGHRATTDDAEQVFFDDPERGGSGLMVVGPGYATRVIDGSGDVLSAFWASGELADGMVRVGAVVPEMNAGVYEADKTATVRASVRNPSVTGVGKVATTGQITREADVSATRPFYPQVSGTGARVSARGYESLRAMEVDLADRPV